MSRCKRIDQQSKKKKGTTQKYTERTHASEHAQYARGENEQIGIGYACMQ